jgi:hypothetical protein
VLEGVLEGVGRVLAVGEVVDVGRVLEVGGSGVVWKCGSPARRLNPSSERPVVAAR